MQRHLAPRFFGHGHLGVAAPGQGRQARLDLLIGCFVAAAAQSMAVRAIAIGDYHAVATLLVFGVDQLLAVGTEHGLRNNRIMAITATEAAFTVGRAEGGGGSLPVQVAVIHEPVAQKHFVGHIQRRADADFHIAGNSCQVEDILDGGVAVALGHVVPDALASEAGIAQKKRRRAVASRVLVGHIPHIAVHVHAPALGGVGRGAAHEPVGQLEQVGALQHFLQRAAVHHVVEQHLGHLVAQLALKVGLLAGESNLHLAHARKRRRRGANQLPVGVEADVALAQVAHGIIEQQ